MLLKGLLRSSEKLRLVEKYLAGELGISAIRDACGIDKRTLYGVGSKLTRCVERQD